MTSANAILIGIAFMTTNAWAGNEIPCPPPDTATRIDPSLTDVVSTLQKEASCELFPSYGAANLVDGLTPLWAQELIGADLAKQRVKSDQHANKVPFGMFEAVDLESMSPGSLSPKLQACQKDSSTAGCKPFGVTPEILEKHSNNGFSHGPEVANLVADLVVGTGANAQLYVAPEPDASSIDVIGLSDQMVQSGVRLLCSSVFTDPTVLNQALSTLHDHGVINVEASDNFYPKPPVVYSGDTIVVGSLSPFGLTSAFSQSSPDVTVSAPSDMYIQSKYQGNFQTFGGTSGAQPLVCGAISNVISLLPNITSSEIKQILKQTSIRLGLGPRTGENSMVNAYKMLRVAERLRDDWPSNRKQIFTDSKLFDFTAESSNTLKQGKTKLASSDPCQRKQGLDAIRTAFLLNPSSADARKALAGFYSAQKLSWNARFVESFGKVSLDDVRSLLKAPHFTMRETAVRHLSDFGKRSEKDLTSILKTVSATSTQFLGEDPGDTDGIASFNGGIAAIATTGLRQIGSAKKAEQLLVTVIKKNNSNAFLNSIFARLEGTDALTAPIYQACLQSVATPPRACSQGALKTLGSKALPWIDDSFHRFQSNDVTSIIGDLAKMGPEGIALLKKHAQDEKLSTAAREEIQNALKQK